jgi:hypothetical protein
MKTERPTTKCQIGCVSLVTEGYGKVPNESLTRKLRLIVRRRLNSGQVHAFKSTTSLLWNKARKVLGLVKKEPMKAILSNGSFEAGELVRVRSLEEIKATLDPYKRLKGCTFMPEMKTYCGTTQRVFRIVERFVDERDYHMKISNGIVLLEGLHCQGSSDYGRCDRACFYFWRKEWLEKCETSEAGPEPGGS